MIYSHFGTCYGLKCLRGIHVLVYFLMYYLYYFKLYFLPLLYVLSTQLLASSSHILFRLENVIILDAACGSECRLLPIYLMSGTNILLICFPWWQSSGWMLIKVAFYILLIKVFWSSGIMECTWMLFTFENGVPLMC